MSLQSKISDLATRIGQECKALWTAVNGKADDSDSRLSDSREWTADTISQAEAEAGTSTTRRAWTAERVKQAIDVLGEDTTFEVLDANGVVGTGSNQVAVGNHNHSGTYEPAFTKNTAFNKNFGSASGTVTEGNDSRLSDTRTPTDSSVTYAKIAGSLKDRVAEAGTAIDWDDGQIHTKTLTANTTFSFNNLREGKVISLILTGNYTITWPGYMDADHLISGEYDGTTENYIQIHCTNDASGSEEVWWAINTKGA
jgi:hypothetical protein